MAHATDIKTVTEGLPKDLQVFLADLLVITPKNKWNRVIDDISNRWYVNRAKEQSLTVVNLNQDNPFYIEDCRTSSN
jgi:hypothetical protein